MASAIQDSSKHDTLLLNVAIIPPENISDIAVRLSREAGAHGGSFQIDNDTRFVHLTLYMARFYRSRIDSVLAELENIRTTIRQHSILHTGFFFTPGNYYEISYARSPALILMHEIITKSMAEFRFSPESPVREKYFGNYSPEQVLNAKVWGYDLAGEMYRPHITLTHFPNLPKRRYLPTVNIDLSFAASRIGLFEADEMGAARRLITAINLLEFNHRLS